MMNQLHAELGNYHAQYPDDRPIVVGGNWTSDGKYESEWHCGCGASGGRAINDVFLTRESADDHECGDEWH